MRAFCSQMQGLVLVDENGKALRRPMSYMDQRAEKEFAECQTHGITVSGVNVLMLLKSLVRTRAASTSVKDPLWKYKWVRKHEPEVFKKVHKWLDVKEYLICRCTGRFIMTRDSAYSTFLYDSRPGKGCWSRGRAWPCAGLPGLRRRRRCNAHRRGRRLHRDRTDAHLFRHLRLGRDSYRQPEG